MKRNQTFKICSNHFILVYMELKYQKSCDRDFIWNTQDFAEDVNLLKFYLQDFEILIFLTSLRNNFTMPKNINAEIIGKGQQNQKDSETLKEPVEM
jgi:hypothetical protein